MAVGWGSKTWGAAEWGDLSDETVTVTSAGSLSTTNINSVIGFDALADAQLSSDQSKFGNTSLELDGSGDRIQSGDITLGTDSYTWETFAYFNSLSSTQCIWDAGENVGASQNPVVYITATNIQISYAGGTYINVAHGMSTDTWHHIAIVRDGTDTGNLKAYIDGTNVGTGNLGSVGAGATNHVLGGNFAGTFTMDGYLDESRLTRRVVYTGNFTPPTQAFTNDDSDDIWLLHYDGPDGSTVILNSAEEKLTITGDGNVTPDSLSLSPVTGDPNITSIVDVFVDGNEANFAQGDAEPAADANVSITATLGINAEVGEEVEAYPRQGWGRDGWGIAAWGIDADEIVEVAGFTIASAIGSATASIDVSIEATAPDAISTLIGNEDAFTDVDVSVDGQALTTAISDALTQADATADPTTISASTAIGETEAGLKTPVDVTGISASFNLGEVTTTDSLVKLEGIELSIDVGVFQTSLWSEINTGTKVTWSDVDLAA